MERNKKTNQQDNSSEEINIQEQTDLNDVDMTTDPLSGEESELSKIKTELDLQKDKYIRLFAEFDNYKRRSAKERMELTQTAGKDVIISMLEVLDDCDRAEKQMKSDSSEQIKEGVQLVFNKLRSSLQSRGLKAMESIETEFDVHKHEAIAEIPVEDENKKGKVIDEIEKGYYLKDNLIRFAKVIVGK